MSEQPAIRSLTAADAGEWRRLYRGYADFYHRSVDDDMLAQLWRWLEAGDIQGYAAVTADDRPVGIAHWQRILRPLQAAPLAYLHDLYVAPEQRGRGLARALMRHTAAAARAQGCSLMRWATKPDNLAARALYDKFATATDWVIYEQHTGDGN